MFHFDFKLFGLSSTLSCFFFPLLLWKKKSKGECKRNFIFQKETKKISLFFLKVLKHFKSLNFDMHTAWERSFLLSEKLSGIQVKNRFSNFTTKHGIVKKIKYFFPFFPWVYILDLYPSFDGVLNALKTILLFSNKIKNFVFLSKGGSRRLLFFFTYSLLDYNKI